MPGRRILLTLLLLVVGLMLASVTPASAGDDESGGDTSDTDATEFVRGTLTDQKGTRDRDDDEPIVGAEITVVDAAGEVVGVAETDEDGVFELGLPGTGDYTATLDVDSLPDGVGIDEGRETIAFTVRPNQSRPLIFPLGARERSTDSKLDKLPQLVFEGVKFGLVIAMAAVGLSLIFGTTGLTNFAHGEMVTFGAIVAWFLNVDHGIHLIPAAALAMAISAVMGAGLELGLWRQLRKRGVSLLAMMIVSIGLALGTRGVLQFIFGGSIRPYNDYVLQAGTDIGPIRVPPKDLWTIAICLTALILIALALTYTRIGKAMRAVADNPDLAASSGIDVDRVILFVWMSGAALAAMGGVLFAVGERVEFALGFKLLLLMFAAITLGGLGTAYGALLGAVVVGLFIQVSTLFIPTELKNVGALAVLIVVLLVRPQGILGRPERIG